MGCDMNAQLLFSILFDRFSWNWFAEVGILCGFFEKYHYSLFSNFDSPFHTERTVGVASSFWLASSFVCRIFILCTMILPFQLN